MKKLGDVIIIRTPYTVKGVLATQDGANTGQREDFYRLCYRPTFSAIMAFSTKASLHSFSQVVSTIHSPAFVVIKLYILVYKRQHCIQVTSVVGCPKQAILVKDYFFQSCSGRDCLSGEINSRKQKQAIN